MGTVGLSPVGVPVHTPASQVWPAAQGVEQAPQLRMLVLRSTQFCPHCVNPGAQTPAQVPAEQTWPVGQTMPHPPQLNASVMVSTHHSPHKVNEA